MNTLQVKSRNGKETEEYRKPRYLFSMEEGRGEVLIIDTEAPVTGTESQWLGALGRRKALVPTYLCPLLHQPPLLLRLHSPNTNNSSPFPN